VSGSWRECSAAAAGPLRGPPSLWPDARDRATREESRQRLAALSRLLSHAARLCSSRADGSGTASGSSTSSRPTMTLSDSRNERLASLPNQVSHRCSITATNGRHTSRARRPFRVACTMDSAPITRPLPQPSRTARFD
jgi:hypothetical protein